MGQASAGISNQTSSRELLVDLADVPRGRWGAELEHRLRTAIRSGRLRPGARMPSTRSLAVDLGVSRSVVVQAFDQLAAEGYLTTRAGAAAEVSDVCRLRDAQLADMTRTPAPVAPPDRQVDVDLRPGHPNLGGLPRAQWGRAVRIVLRTMTDAEFGYGDSRGLPRLREALADYLGRVRGAVVDPEHLVVVNGFAQGLVVAAGLLRDRSTRVAGVEDPGSAHTTSHLERQGISVVPVPVDDDGIDLDAAPPGLAPARALLVTPAHQYPTGAVLSPARRRRLVAWAERHDGLVIEDDYDAEYRYDHHAVGTIQGMAPDRVILGGSVSKTLAPGLRLGWLAVPAALSADAADHKRAIDLMAPVLDQATLAELITSGSYERHIRRSRVRYKRLRDLVVELIAAELPEASVVGTSAGLHLLVRTPTVADETAVERAALDRGVQVVGLRQHSRGPHPAGFVLGYGHLSDDELRRGLKAFAAAVRNCFPG